MTDLYLQDSHGNLYEFEAVFLQAKDSLDPSKIRGAIIEALAQVHLEQMDFDDVIGQGMASASNAGAVTTAIGNFLYDFENRHFADIEAQLAARPEIDTYAKEAIGEQIKWDAASFEARFLFNALMAGIFKNGATVNHDLLKQLADEAITRMLSPLPAA